MSEEPLQPWENPAVMREIADLLANFPSDGKPQNSEAAQVAIMCGFIVRHEVTKPCKTCGTARYEYAYFKVSGAGKMFLAAMLAEREKQA